MSTIKKSKPELIQINLDTYNELIESNKSIIQECINILNQQNKDSYRTIKVPKLTSTITLSVKSVNTFDIQLLDFYKQLLPIIQFVHNLKYVMKDLEYTNEDLSINIDRSPTFILDLEHKLYDYKITINKYYEQLENNNIKIINYYCNNLSLDKSYTIDLITIELLFKCMEYDFKFIPFGTTIFAQLFTNNMIKPIYKQNITELSNALKIKYLITFKEHNHSMTDKQTRLLQTFNLIPSTSNISLSEVFNRLFGISIKNITIDTLENILRSTSKTLYKTISFIIIATNNNDFYYDIDNFFNREKLSILTSNVGVNIEYIDIFKTLQSNLISKKISNNVYKYNYSSDAENYILWTNDLISFKLRETRVPNNIINKIINNQSSEVIDLYNNRFEQQMLDTIKNDKLISYKQIKYLSFDIDNEEIIFIKTLCSSIEKYIKSIKNISNEKDMVSKIIKIIQLEFNNFKPFHINKKTNSMQPILIYNNNAIQIANRVKKDIIQWYNNKEPINQIETIIKTIIASNDNIYTKFISSYYLEMSGSDQ